MKKLFGRKNKLKKEYDERLRELMLEAKEEWERAREVESYVNDYDEGVLAQRKMAECKYFYLFREAKLRNLGN
ncbi:YaaL family protein [Sporosarcina obsidiansis]|uniref:YaaL family protein n=1 Tax=Sporosarcina obsidiansis TaxID=2660748 RepID=UPI001E417225|nr:YaaL family protein [Sporosarcina obsidiansis]